MIIAFIPADVILQPDSLNNNHIQPDKKTRNIWAGAWQVLVLWYILTPKGFTTKGFTTLVILGVSGYDTKVQYGHEVRRRR